MARHPRPAEAGRAGTAARFRSVENGSDALPATATEGIIVALERMALEERQPGEYMPSEASLAATLGVSRLTVREATRALVARGYLELRKGRRPKVLAPDGSLLGHYFRASLRRDPSALLDLLEVRRALEVHIASLAATRASRSSITAMHEAIDQMARDPEDEDAFQDGDQRFHEALAAATGNTMLRQLIEQLAEPLMTSRRRSYAGHKRSGLPLMAVVDAHRAILDAVEDRDPPGAAAAMRSHLGQTEKDLRTALRDDAIA
jgi:GntR family transcriptional regulator, transcriptional repressor for pyruvate dehydrogenase complex